jgi:acyl carrier protein
MDATMTTMTESEVLQQVAAMVREVIDLELESIEFVALAERMKGRYGRGVDFASWLSSMELKEIIGLEVGELVRFIVRCLSQSATA